MCLSLASHPVSSVIPVAAVVTAVVTAVAAAAAAAAAAACFRKMQKDCRSAAVAVK